jgi:tetratricopeptide (TPR) repeat protein
LTSEATQLYKRVLELPVPDAQADPKGAALMKQARTRSQAQLIGLLRGAGDFEAAIEQARQLATDNPRALEPQMELGRCLQARAEKNPATYDEAIAHWTRIRGFLQSMRKKPPEYYEVIYNAAWCLYAQAYQTQEDIQKRCTTAIGLLTSAMVLNEKLSGPDMVEKYKVLLDTIKKFQQESGGAAAPAAESK